MTEQPTQTKEPLTEAVMMRLMDECTAGELAEILRAYNGLPDAKRSLLMRAPENPWPSAVMWSVFWLSCAAVMVARIWGAS
jgi:hypothetical protein